MRANIWIREENVEEWEKLVNKSEWVNWHLDEKRTKGGSSDLGGEPLEPIVRQELPAEPTERPKTRVRTDICKVHGIEKEQCRFMKH